MMILSKEWWKCAGIRAVKTFAQTMIPLIPADIMINAIDWRHVLGISATAAVLSLITSLAGIPELESEEKDE